MREETRLQKTCLEQTQIITALNQNQYNDASQSAENVEDLIDQANFTIEQILSIIDIIDVYHGPENRQNAAPATVSEQPEQTDMQPGPDHTDASTNEEDAPLPETPAKKDD